MFTIVLVALLVVVAIAGFGAVFLLGRYAQLAERGEGPLAKLVARQKAAFADHIEDHRRAWSPVADAIGLPLRGADRPDEPTLRIGGPSPHHPSVRVEVAVRAPHGVRGDAWEQAARGAWPRVPANQQEALQPTVTLRAVAGAPLPAGLHVQPESAWTQAQAYFGARDLQTGEPALDDRAHIQAEDADGARVLFGDPAVCKALRLALARPGQLQWTAEAATLEVALDREVWEHGRFDVQDVPASLWALSDLVAAAAAAQRRPWQAAAEALGLRLGGRHGRPMLAGAVDGVSVEVTCTGFSSAEVRATLPATAHGIALSAEDPGGDLPTVRMPNPVLGAALSGRARDPEAGARLLAQDAVATAAIEVLRGHAGACVTPAGLVLVPVQRVEAVPAAAREAARLVHAFAAAFPGERPTE